MVFDVAVALELSNPALGCFRPYVEPAWGILFGEVVLNFDELDCCSEARVDFYGVYDSTGDEVSQAVHLYFLLQSKHLSINSSDSHSFKSIKLIYTVPHILQANLFVQDNIARESS